MADLQPVRGTRDLIGEEQRRHAHVIDTARRITGLYGFEEWQTPIFEDTNVFARTLGDTSDVVTKEMYTFEDRGGDSVTLRPEGTAGVCRALVSNGLTQSLPQKVFYAGPMFRYERPQKGRYRQFHQIGAELIGPAEPLADAEMIALASRILRDLGLGEDVSLQLNTLGDRVSRSAHRAALVSFFSKHQDRLSPESQERLTRNPLRILDSKDAGDRLVVAESPRLSAYLTEEAEEFWDLLKKYLHFFGVKYTENPTLVRGLDYYNHTVFEFVTTKLGSQGTVLAGGRYDGLVEQMGGPAIAAVGWAAGVERLAALSASPGLRAPSVVVIPTHNIQENLAAVLLLERLRDAGLKAEISYRGTTKTRMERANKMGAKYVLFTNGLASPPLPILVRLKNLVDGTEQTYSFEEVVQRTIGLIEADNVSA